MIDLKKFKKVSSDKDSAVLRHDDGHEIKIIPSALSPKFRKQLEAIPMADGGKVSVSEEDRPSTSEDVVAAEQNPPTDYRTSQEKAPVESQDPSYLASIGVPRSSKVRLTEEGIPAPEESKTPLPSNPDFSDATVSPNVTPPPSTVRGQLQSADEGSYQPSVTPLSTSPQAAPAAPADGGGLSVLSGPALSQAGQQSQGQVDPLTAQMQQAYQQNADRQAQLASDFASRKANIDVEHQALVHDILNGHIDTSNFWKANNKGALALGAALAGFGAALTGTSNPVPGMIQGAQDNFLKAELANQENPKSLLGDVRAAYQDDRDSIDMMRIISNEMLNNQINKVTAPLNSATAQAKAAEIQLQLFQNTEAIKQQMAMRQALMGQQGQAGQGKPQLDPSTKANLMLKTGLMNDKQYEDVTKEIDQNSQVEHLRSSLMGSFNDLGNRVLAGTFSPKDRKSAINAYSGLLEHLSEGRFNLQEAQQQIEAVLPMPLDSQDTVQRKQTRLHALLDGLRKEGAGRGLGITVPRSSVDFTPAQ